MRDGVWGGQRLEAGGEVGRFADHLLFLCGAAAVVVTDDDEVCGDADPRLQRVSQVKLADGKDHLQGGEDGALGVVPRELADSRNRSARRHPCISRRSRRTGVTTRSTVPW